jgi:hypothetical protein
MVQAADHKVRIYKECHSVCPHVVIRTLPTTFSPASMSPPPPPEPGGRAHSPAGEGLGESQFRRLEKRLSTLPTLCYRCNFISITCSNGQSTLTCLVVQGKMHDMMLRYTASTSTVHGFVIVVKQKLHEPVCIAVH